MSQHLTLTGHSTALFSTWIFLEEWRLLFDAGDGIMAHLMHRSRRIRTIAMSHADRDHVFGLLQLNHHNSGHNLETVLYPADARSIERLRDFAWQFDRETAGKYEWVPVRAGDSNPISNDLALTAVANSHLSRMGEQARSFGYVVMRKFRKLKAEFANLDQNELRRLGTERGSSFLSEPQEEPLLAYSGDTGVLAPDTWLGAKTLIHESTWLRDGEVEENWPGHEHSTMPDVLRLARVAQLERLVLHHFSGRYRMGEIAHEVRREAGELGLKFPIWVIPPGQTVEDLFGTTPVFQPD
jgi:ribonuclease Z